ncbi:Glyceraldehyde-3-phosphate dehydrogenase [bacterium HR19]|nr:Glyceraldehyde-3-phosphate dehydrogenase [bacterium HR19]
MKVGINGFGRIGRLVFKIALDSGIDVVAINDVVPADVCAHLLKYDSVFGRYKRKVEVKGNSIIIDGEKEIKVFSETDPEKIPWDKIGADLVVESSGKFTERDKAEKHLKAGAKKVVITAPAKNPDITIVIGVNENQYSPSHKIISNASCTTNCFAMLVKVLHENFKIKYGELTTIHSYTNDQRIIDAPHKDLRRARSAATNIIPTSTGAAKAIYEIFPELKGRLSALAIRVPTQDVSVCDFSCVVEKKTDKEEVNQVFKDYAEKKLKRLLEYTEDEIVSSDVIGNPASCVFDSKLTEVVDGNFVKVIGWYDNEYGYASRVVDLIKIVQEKG